MRAVLVAAGALVLAGCGETPPERALSVHGDSIAVGSREGLYKIYNFAPTLDPARWSYIVARGMKPARQVILTAKGGSTMAESVERMRAHPEALNSPTVIYDLINDSETVEGYLADLEEAVSLVKNERLLIMPQVPRAGGRDSPERIAKLAAVNNAVRQRWPDNSFSHEEALALIIDMQPENTRYDGLHRNANGEKIEARHIEAWMTRRSWI